MTWRGDVVGHRGSAGTAPENTIESFEEAIAAGADWVEFDVRSTSDGQAVVFHDANVDRFVPGSSERSVKTCSLQEMKAIDAGAALGRPGCFVPSLDETLDRLAGRIKMNVEVKGSGADGLIVLPLVVEALRRRKLLGDVVISSFHEPVLRRAVQDAPDVPRAYIVDARATGDVAGIARSLSCEALHPDHRITDEALVARCRAEGLKVRCWTVNEPQDVRRMTDLGVDAIVSDFPARVREMTR